MRVMKRLVKARIAIAMVMAGIGFSAIALTGCGSEEKQNLARRIIYHPGNGKDIKLEWTIKKLATGDTLLHGVMKEFYRGGSNKKSVEWKDGKKDGTAQAWYDNGGQQWQKSYLAGAKAATWRAFYSDGSPWLVLQYHQGALEGKAQKWDRQASDSPQEAEFSKGNCASGKCDLLTLPELPALPDEASPAQKLQLNRDREILSDFLD